MNRNGLIRSLALMLFITAICISGVFAQVDTSQDPSSRPRMQTEESAKIYKDWVGKDVKYIITKEEKKAFEQLKTDEERENFIANFWLRRDPNSDTEENEYREEYYERIAYANENFASGIQGWRTDRGKIYITWGKPDSIESHPAGGAYDRPAYEGGGSTTTYAYETWFYRYLEGVGSGIEIEFVDPTGTGEYRLAQSPYEKDALANVPGAGLNAAEQLGLGKGDRITGYQGGGASYQREQDSPFAIIAKIQALSVPPSVKYGDLQGVLTDSPVIDNNPLDFQLRVDFFRQSDERVVTAFTIQTPNKELAYESVGGIQTARMNIFGRITAVSNKRSGIFEDSVTASATTEELTEAKNRESIYQKLYALAPGTYKVDVVVRDVVTGNRGIQSVGFTVPRYDNEKLSTSTLIMASKLRSTTERDIGGMFVIGDAKVIPNLSGEYEKGQEVGIYLQVYNAGIDQTTLRPAVDVEYVLSKGGKQLLVQQENWEGLSDSGQRLTLARLLPTSQLEKGEYEIKIKIKDRVTGQLLEPKGKFTIK